VAQWGRNVSKNETAKKEILPLEGEVENNITTGHYVYHNMLTPTNRSEPFVDVFFYLLYESQRPILPYVLH